MLSIFDQHGTHSCYPRFATKRNNNERCSTREITRETNLFDKTKITHSRRLFGKRKRCKKYINIRDIQQAFEIMKKIINGSTTKLEIPFGMYL